MMSDDDDDSDFEAIPPALHVEDMTDFNPNIAPSTGDEYLQHVVYEASHCPDVVVANIDKCKIKEPIISLIEVEESTGVSELAPSTVWQQHQVAEFSSTRIAIARSRTSDKFKPVTMPHPKEEDKWFSICFEEKRPPLLSLLLSISQPRLTDLLELHIDWMDKGLRDNQGPWVYAILACLEMPLPPLACSVLRDLARQCARLRSTKTAEDNDVVVLNLLICLVAKYFGQLDLAD